MKMIRNVLIASTILFALQVLFETFPGRCKGWSCDTVYCPDGYAVLVPGKGYLPCEKFDQYVDGDSSVVVSQ